jgi:hypothetical protein
LQITKSKNSIEATGAVTPNQATQQLMVTLLKKRGGDFAVLARQAPLLDAASTYRTSFARSSGGTCKVVARYPGDVSHLASETTQQFSC